MSLNNMKKEELELLSYKDITNLILEEKGEQNTASLFKKIIKLLELPEATFDQKIGDYYTSLATDKRFILLDNGKWDLRSRHTSDKLIKVELEEDDDDDEEEIEEIKEDEEESEGADFDSVDSDEDDIDDDDDDLKDLVILDEDEIEEEQ